MSAVSGEGRRKPADIRLRLSSTKTGDQPEPDWWTVSPAQPRMVGWLGPQRSMSSTPTSFSPTARQRARLAVTVDLPTPPFPDRTRILCFTPASLSAITATSGSGKLGPETRQESASASSQLISEYLPRHRFAGWDNLRKRQPCRTVLSRCPDTARVCSHPSELCNVLSMNCCQDCDSCGQQVVIIINSCSANIDLA